MQEGCGPFQVELQMPQHYIRAVLEAAGCPFDPRHGADPLSIARLRKSVKQSRPSR
jgi:hypothetical protein